MSKVTLGQVATEVRESTKDPAGLPIVGLEHLIPGEIRLTQWSETSENTFTKLFHKGQVLFGRRRAYQKKAAVADFDGVCSGDITVIAAKPDRLLPDLLPFIVNDDRFFDFAMEKSAGSLSPRVKWAQLAEYAFDLPDDIEEQRSHAKLLWAIERSRSAYQNLLSQMDELVKSQFVEMFGDPVINEKGWKLVPLSEIAEIRIGPFGSLLHKEDYVQGGHPLINPSHIVDGLIQPDEDLSLSDEKYNELAPYQLRINDVVLGRRGEMGRCAVVHEEGYFCGTGSLIIRPNKAVAPYFLQKIISYPSFRREIEGVAVGVTMQNLNVPIVSNFKIPLLPCNMQERYLQLVENTDKSKLAIRQALESLEKSRSAIITKVFG